MKQGKVVFVVIKRKCKRPEFHQLAQVAQEKRWYSQGQGQGGTYAF